MRRKPLFLSVVVISALVLSAVLGACQPTPAPAPAPAETIVLRYSGGQAIENPITQAMYHWAELVEERTNGRVRIQVFPAEQLYSPEELPTVVPAGVLDMAEFPAGDLQGLSEAALISDPFWLFDSWEHVDRVHRAGFDIVDGELQAKNVKLLFWMFSGGNAGPITKVPVHTLEDLEGLKIRGWGEAITKMLDALGATGVYVTFGEVYQALQTGTVDGAMSGFTQYQDMSWYENAKYVVDVTTSYGVFLTGINLDKWNSLPKDIQDIMLTAGRDTEVWNLPVAIEADIAAKDALREVGVILYELPIDELARWRERTVEPFYTDFINKTPENAEIYELVDKLR